MGFGWPSRCSTHLSTDLKRTQSKDGVMVWPLLPLYHTTFPCMWLFKKYTIEGNPRLFQIHTLKTAWLRWKLQTGHRQLLLCPCSSARTAVPIFLCSGFPQHWISQYVHVLCGLETHKLVCELPNLMLFLSLPAFGHPSPPSEQAESKKIMHKSKLLYKMI